MGRPRLARGVYSLEDPPLVLPREILLDTSFVVEALVSTQPRHEQCRAFLERLFDSETTLYFNRLLEVELAEAAFRYALEERFSRSVRERARRDGRARRRAGRLMEQARSAWGVLLEAFSHVCVELEEVAPDAPMLMRRYGLKSYDAIHVATAIYTGANTAVTLDVDFANVPAPMLSLYTTSHRVHPARRRRGGS